MNNIILHVPHDSIDIPDEYRQQFVLSDDELARELLRMTDRHTAELFGAQEGRDLIIPVSRLLVDVERFEDDEKEVMAKRGMGVLYERTHDQRPLRRDLATAEREDLLERYYRPHHAAFERRVDATLSESGRTLIIDCHSFPSRRLPYEIAEDDTRPGICIGTDPFHTPQHLRDAALGGFAEAGFSVAVDKPFAGAITPMKHYQRDDRVKALMVEVRRDLYMNEETGEKNGQFDSVRAVVAEVIDQLCTAAEAGS